MVPHLLALSFVLVHKLTNRNANADKLSQPGGATSACSQWGGRGTGGGSCPNTGQDDDDDDGDNDDDDNIDCDDEGKSLPKT